MISVKRKIKRILDLSKWSVQIQRRKKINSSSIDIDLDDRKCLYIIPHADDELFGGYETISRNSDSIL